MSYLFKNVIYSQKMVKCFRNIFQVYAKVMWIFGEYFKCLASLFKDLWLNIKHEFCKKSCLHQMSPFLFNFYAIFLKN